MPLLDQDPGVVDRFSEAVFEDLVLEPSVQKVFDFETEDVIEFLLAFVEDANSEKSSEEGVTFEESFGVFFIQGQ